MAEEIEQYIEEYRHSTNVVESCRCIRNILDVFLQKMPIMSVCWQR